MCFGFWLNDLCGFLKSMWRSMKQQQGEQVCQICGDGVGTTVDGELFVACDVCGFPVCRPFYEYERKDGNQSCPQCKTKYKRRRGSPPVSGEDGGTEDVASDVEYSAGNQVQKQKIADRMSRGRGGEMGISKNDSGEFPRNHTPLITHSHSPGSYLRRRRTII